MNQEALKPSYPYEPFGAVTLARILREDLRTLYGISNAPHQFYRPIDIVSRNKVRRVFDACAPLKSIQARIQCLLLRKVVYPPYLQGGIRDEEHSRDFVTNASLHCNKRIVIAQDIEDFFPSISAELIYDTWRFLFHYPREVAKILTLLTTLDGKLPQGAKTSSYLANLALWQREPVLVEELMTEGFVYSRYIDDITTSTDRNLSGLDISKLMRRIAGMCSRLGFRLKRRKLRINHADERMSTTGLTINRRASLPKEIRSDTRRLVYECECLIQASEGIRETAFYAIRWSRASGRVALLQRLHPAIGGPLRTRLRVVKPLVESAAAIIKNDREKPGDTAITGRPVLSQISC